MQKLHTHLNTIINDLSKNGYAICENFLPESIIKALAAEAENRFNNGEMHVAKTGKNTSLQQPTFRNDSIYWLDEDSQNLNTQTYFTQMHVLKNMLNKSLLLNLHDMETHLAVYPISGVYLKHVDQFKQTNYAPKQQRLLSSILYLNDNWQAHDGGELRLYLNNTNSETANNYIDILPSAGRLVLFLSADFWHEVLPATRYRISLTGWFRAR